MSKKCILIKCIFITAFLGEWAMRKSPLRCRQNSMARTCWNYFKRKKWRSWNGSWSNEKIIYRSISSQRKIMHTFCRIIWWSRIGFLGLESGPSSSDPTQFVELWIKKQLRIHFLILGDLTKKSLHFSICSQLFLAREQNIKRNSLKMAPLVSLSIFWNKRLLSKVSRDKYSFIYKL